ncbi:hypothetical protein DPMN_122475 [Dreissena polymorpha]|uniref:Uncharacterized protein n=1 Tax=Dreissena polymorpha TaxID=45954 RepID=A0A9D4GNN8_DREPO|nr:hypothetical protein DPMN_122475 [Dreissena polymorpha]
MVNSTTNTSTDINMDGEKLEEVTSCKYVGTTLSKYGTSTAEVQIIIAMATSAMTRRKIQAFEHKCLRRLLRITCTEHKTNE